MNVPQRDLSGEERMSTVTVLELTQKPSLQEFGRIFEEHYDLIYRTAYSVTRAPQDAEDVVQTIFLRLLRREVPPDFTKNPKGYFYRAAVNVSLQAVRQRERHILSGDSERLPGGSDSRSAGQAHHEDEMDRRLWQAIAELSESAAQILILRYIHDYSLADIARLLGTSRSTIAVSLFRSRARLKKLIRASEGVQS
jgi:RNA polymerase sigma-70 factor (ECF subfamily)